MRKHAWAGSSAWYERLTCTLNKTSFTDRSVNWRAFEKWLIENFSHNYAKDTFNYSKLQIPKLSTFMDFMLVSGLRLREAFNSYNLIIELAKEGRLSEY